MSISTALTHYLSRMTGRVLGQPTATNKDYKSRDYYPTGDLVKLKPHKWATKQGYIGRIAIDLALTTQSNK